jgi:hypothetical protein
MRRQCYRFARSSMAGAVGLTALAGLFAGSSHARDDAAQPGKPSVSGRVLDESGKPIAGARVRLYRRESRWERRHPTIEETTAGPDGAFHLNSALRPLPPTQMRGQPPYVLVADRPGKAVGWRTIPNTATTFEGDIVLTAPAARVITVVDSTGRPVAGARVAAYGIGDSSSPSPLFRELLDGLRPDDGPTTSIADASGQATFSQLPKTDASFVATANGFGEGYAFREQNAVRLTPSAALSGTVTGPDGKPLAGIKVVLFTSFMWDFENALTDAQGRYQFHDLRAKGWDMSAWGASARPGNGVYKLWIDDDQFAVPTQTVSLEPKTRRSLDLRAQQPGVIRVTVTENGTDNPVAGVRIWGFDEVTGSSSRFNAYTDVRGRATFYSVPAKIWLGIASPPEGLYLESPAVDGPGGSKQIDFNGAEAEIRLVMPRVAGSLITISGLCARPGSAPVANSAVVSAIGVTANSRNVLFQTVRGADAAGHFTLDNVPAGQTIHLYAETKDHKLAGTATVVAPNRADPAFRASITLRHTEWLEMPMRNAQGQPIRSTKLSITPQIDGHEIFQHMREVQSDENGRVLIDGIVPGLKYHIQEVLPTSDGAHSPVGAKPPWLDEVLVLVPQQ